MGKLHKKHYFCSMIELAKHIEVLLLENDCVIVPGLGGFIAHNRQAEFKESNGLFCAPVRTIGFNPQLVMNDGLLVQTYMQAYNTDFPDATRKIEETVSSLKEQLYKNGEANLPNVGTLYYTMNGAYVFEPSAETFFTPHLYGLSDFTLTPLKVMKETEETVTIHPFIPKKQKPSKSFISDDYNQYGRTLRRVARHAVGVAAAILLFFLLSVPVENTYMDDASYASLSAESMFDAIRGRSVATNLLCSTQDSNQVNLHQKAGINRAKNNINTLKPAAVKIITVPQEEDVPVILSPTDSDKSIKKPIEDIAKNDLSNKIDSIATLTDITKPMNSVSDVIEQPAKGNYIIVASLPTLADAQKQLKVYQSKGYSSARVLENNNRHRIALYYFKKSEDARKKLQELRKQKAFEGAWLFSL